MTRARRERVLATAVARSLVGKTPIISHLLSPVCTQSSYCFHLAMGKVGAGFTRDDDSRIIGSKVINGRPPIYIIHIQYLTPGQGPSFASHTERELPRSL